MEKETYSEYRMTFDFHTHTIYSHGFPKPHGKGTVRQNVEEARRKGLREIAISDHGPGHLFYGIRRERISEQRQEIEALKREYPDIRIWQSVEANLKEGGNHLDVDPELARRFDFLLAGYHYGVANSHLSGNKFASCGLMPSGQKANLRRVMTEMYVNALYENDIRILTHPGDKGPVDMAEVARACGERGTWMEISTWHTHLTTEEIRTAMKVPEVRFVISSDAHTPERVGSYQGGILRALEAGLDPARIVNIECRENVDRRDR